MKIEISIKDIDGEQYLCIKLADLTQLKRKRVSFKPPTIEEIKEYCKERRNNINISQFMNHYESNGWMVGKNKMKSWQAAVRTWEGTNFNNKVESKGTNMADPPPEIFGLRSATAVTRAEYLQSKK